MTDVQLPLLQALVRSAVHGGPQPIDVLRRIAQHVHPLRAQKLSAARALQRAQLPQEARGRVGVEDAVDGGGTVDELKHGGLHLARAWV
eukprot:scaffold114785_cov75-Phaeocystis_antarctica.AAC.1